MIRVPAAVARNSKSAVCTESHPLRPFDAERQTEDAGNYGYDLYDFDDLIFQTSGDFSSLEEAKRSALSAAATLEAA